MWEAILTSAQLFFRSSLHFTKEIASYRFHARVEALIVIGPPLPHPLVEVGWYVGPQTAAVQLI